MTEKSIFRLFTELSSLELSKMDKQTKEKGFETAYRKVQFLGNLQCGICMRM